MSSAPRCDRMNEMSTFTIVVEPEEDGGFFVVVPALPGCFTRGGTIEECRERGDDDEETAISLGLHHDRVSAHLVHPVTARRGAHRR